MTKETQQQPAAPAPTAPAEAKAPPPGKPTVSMDNRPAVDAAKIAKAAAAVIARQTERGEGPEDAPAPPPAAAAPPAAPESTPQPAAPQERPALSKTEYWEHLDELQAQLRQAQAQAKRGLPENVHELPVQERLRMVGVDPRDPQVLDTLLDALAATGEQAPPPAPAPPQLPAGADPALVQLLQQQQATMTALQQRIDQFEGTSRTTQEQLQQQQRQQAMRAEEAKFEAVLREAPGRWPVAQKALEKGIVPLGFANQVAEAMMRQMGGQPPTYAQVLTGIDTYLREEATKTASLLGEIHQPPPPVAPVAAAAPEPGLEPAPPAEASDRKLTRAERVKRAAALIKDRQRNRTRS